MADGNSDKIHKRLASGSVTPRSASHQERKGTKKDRKAAAQARAAENMRMVAGRPGGRRGANSCHAGVARCAEPPTGQGTSSRGEGSRHEVAEDSGQQSTQPTPTQASTATTRSGS